MKDETTQDGYTLKLSGKGELPYKLEIGRKYGLAMEGTITAITESDLDNGAHLFTHTFKPILITVINEKGEAIKLPDTRTHSQLFRARLYGIWSKTDGSLDFNQFYERVMMNLIHHAPEVAEMYGV